MDSLNQNIPSEEPSKHPFTENEKETLSSQYNPDINQNSEEESIEDQSTITGESTENLNENNTMEAYHPHHPTHKKKWTEYLLEFSMIFLAVFLSFIAENKREHRIENKRLEKYMSQMTENLKADINRGKECINQNIVYTQYLDSLNRELNLIINGKTNANKAYYYFLKGNLISIVLYKQTAIIQLKSSGNLRILENRDLTNKTIEYYDRWVTAADINFKGVYSDYEKTSNSAFHIFYSEHFNEVNKPMTTFSHSNKYEQEKHYETLLTKNPPLSLLENNRKDLEIFKNQIYNLKNNLLIYNSFVNLNIILADSLRNDIRKEFHFEN